MRIYDLFPALAICTAEEGLSITAANAKLVDNQNKASEIESELTSISSLGVYNTTTEYITSGGQSVKEYTIPKANSATFNHQKKVADIMAEQSKLAFGIKTIKAVSKAVTEMDSKWLYMKKNNEPVLEYPTKPQLTNSYLEDVLNYSSVEKILNSLTAQGLSMLSSSELFYNAISLEAKVAAIGQLFHKNSLLKKITTSPTSLPIDEDSNSIAIVVKLHTLAYNDDEVNELKSYVLTLQEEYQDLQGQLNGYKKRIKDELRNLEVIVNAEHDKKVSEYEQEERRRTVEGEKLKMQLLKEIAELKIIA